jgi:hypothetical protein
MSYALGREEAPLVAESKARKDGTGFTTLEKWLGEYDALFLRRNHADPMIVLPWRVWAQLSNRCDDDALKRHRRRHSATTYRGWITVVLDEELEARVRDRVADLRSQLESRELSDV